MGLSFAQPLAFLALLGLPAVLLLHFLQSRDRKVRVSTLFLLDVLPEETRRGAVFTRLLAGPQLWLQLLAVVCFALLLARPLWLRKESIQSVAIVVDVSASMQAFRDELQEPLRRKLAPLTETAGKTEWHILPSDATGARIYAGDDLDTALEALKTLPMTIGPHDPTPSLVRARQLTGTDGAVLFVTDHPPAEAPVGVEPLGVGSPTLNNSISGIRFERVNGQWQWEASLLNWGAQPATTMLSLVIDGQDPINQTVLLQPGGINRARGLLPDGIDRGELRLPDDDFSPDNRYPFVVPELNEVTVELRVEDTHKDWAEKVIGTVSGTKQVGGNATLMWRRTEGAVPPPIAPHEIVILAKGRAATFKQPVAVDHPLTRDLPWNGLIALPRQRNPFKGEEVLVWMGRVPIISLLSNEAGNQLLVNLDPEQSNVDRSPAVILLLNRYIKQIAAKQAERRALNLEAGQQLNDDFPNTVLVSTFSPLSGTTVTETQSTPPQKAPASPGFWTLSEPDADSPRVRAAVSFGALEEADLRRASSSELPQDWVAGRRELNSEKDLLRPWLMVLLSGCLIGSWITGTQTGGKA